MRSRPNWPVLAAILADALLWCGVLWVALRVVQGVGRG